MRKLFRKVCDYFFGMPVIRIRFCPEQTLEEFLEINGFAEYTKRGSYIHYRRKTKTIGLLDSYIDLYLYIGGFENTFIAYKCHTFNSYTYRLISSEPKYSYWDYDKYFKMTTLDRLKLDILNCVNEITIGLELFYERSFKYSYENSNIVSYCDYYHDGNGKVCSEDVPPKEVATIIDTQQEPGLNTIFGRPGIRYVIRRDPALRLYDEVWN